MAKDPRHTRKLRLTADERRAQIHLLRAYSRGFYDATNTASDMGAHFATADAGSADAHANPDARKVLRERARYEYANNGYAKGIIDTQVLKTIGRRPMVRIMDRNVSRDLTRGIERKIADWMKAAQFGEQLRLAMTSRMVSGEVFFLKATRETIHNPVKFAWKLIETDQCESLQEDAYNPNTEYVDGVKLDSNGDPVSYSFLRSHPGSENAQNSFDYITVPASDLVHYYIATRPGQHRGVSEMVAMLFPIAALRRYTNATIKAAETAASITFLLETDEIAEDAEEGLPAFDLTQIKHDMGMSLPDGWKGKQLKAEQPIDTYSDFKKEIIAECGRSIQQPKNRAAADSQDASFSSARLDHLDHNDQLRIERDRVVLKILQPTLVEWASEVILHDEYLDPGEQAYLNEWLETEQRFPPYVAHWDGHDSFDRVKDATANDTELRNGSRSLTEILEQRGMSLEDHIDSIAREQDYAEEAGVVLGYQVLAPGAIDPTNPEIIGDQNGPENRPAGEREADRSQRREAGSAE